VTEYGNAFATADYGTMIDGELYVLGRMDDTIIIDGRNIYPDDVESLVSASAAGPRVSLVAAVPHPEGGAIVIVAECRGSAADDVVAAAEITEGMRRTVSGATGVRVAEVALVQRGQIPTTTSGKIRRKDCARYWAEGRLESWA
jgi:acyl-CoA synthetase (AMP-forming)/AMP-acid ligase II